MVLSERRPALHCIGSVVTSRALITGALLRSNAPGWLGAVEVPPKPHLSGMSRPAKGAHDPRTSSPKYCPTCDRWSGIIWALNQAHPNAIKLKAADQPVLAAMPRELGER